MRRVIEFSTSAGDLGSCDAAARNIAHTALGADYRLTSNGYRAIHQAMDNSVMVWRGEYTATDNTEES